MCRFLVMAVPGSASRAAVAHAMASRGLNVGDLPGQLRLSGVPESSLLFRPTTTACDCDSAVGSTIRRQGKPPEPRALAGRRAAGLSEAKIGRWLAQRRAARTRKERSRTDSGGESCVEEADRIRRAMLDLVQVGKLSWVGLVPPRGGERPGPRVSDRPRRSCRAILFPDICLPCPMVSSSCCVGRMRDELATLGAGHPRERGHAADPVPRTSP
jgi:hypothetical protein